MRGTATNPQSLTMSAGSEENARVGTGVSGKRHTLFIGDVHGCLRELDALLALCRFCPDRDALVLLGDLVGKGPHSTGVVDRAQALCAQAVLGNHDARWLSSRRGRPATAESGEPSSAALAWLERLPHILFFSDLNLLAVHGALNPAHPIHAQRARDTLYGRSFHATSKQVSANLDAPPWALSWPGPQTVLFGHDARRGLQHWPHALGLDTGCVYGGWLSAFIAETGRFFAVKARGCYARPHPP